MAEINLSIDGDGMRTAWHGIVTAGDNVVSIETNGCTKLDTFTLNCTAGVYDVFVTLDGTNWTTAPLSLSDLGGISTDPVLTGTANRLFGFAGVFQGVRVQQNGGVGLANLVMIGRRTST